MCQQSKKKKLYEKNKWRPYNIRDPKVKGVRFIESLPSLSKKDTKIYSL